MKYILVIFAVCMFQSGFSQWTNLGLNDKTIRNLTILDDTIYASTNNGIYKKNYLSQDTIWFNCGMQDYCIIQTLIPDNNTFISLLLNMDNYTTRLYKSNDAGRSFSLMLSDNSLNNDYVSIGIANPGNNFDTLYLLDFNLRSFDGGKSWESMNNKFSEGGNYYTFIKVNPVNHSQIILGGTSGIEAGILCYSDDNGDNWKYPLMNGFNLQTNIITDFDIDKDNIWYAAAVFGQIARSYDEGMNWNLLLEIPGPGNVKVSPSDKRNLYASGGSTVNNKVFLYYSPDEGETWDLITFDCIEKLQHVNSMLIKSINNIDNVFLGGRGVFLYKNSFNLVSHPKSNEEFILFPNPVRDVLTIKTDKRIEKISVYNSEGKKLRSVEFRNYIDTNDFPAGIYLIRIEIEGNEYFTKFIK